MFTFRKSNRSASSRRQIQLKEVKDSVIVLPHHQFRVVLETSSINFELKSDEEQDVLLDSFQNFLNSLPSQLQILVRVREVALDTYLENLAKHKQTEEVAIYKQQIDNYTDFIKNLISGNKILSRRFYIILPYTSTEKDFSVIKEQLSLQKDIVVRGLEKLGMKARLLDNLELLDLFYSFYNQVESHTQDLKRETVEMLMKGEYA